MTAAQQRKKASSKLFKALRRGWRRIKGDWPDRDIHYLRFLRDQPCLLAETCGCCPFPILKGTEAAHTGPHGIGQKASDYDAIPLCRWAHQEAKDAQGKTRTWFEDHGLNRQKVLDDLRARYEGER